MTWFRTNWHDSVKGVFGGPQIEAVEVHKTTSSSVWVGQRREAKRSQYRNYFETMAEARAFIADHQRQKIEHHRKSLAAHEETLRLFDDGSGATNSEPA